jgi:voltage-gated potassium channel
MTPTSDDSLVSRIVSGLILFLIISNVLAVLLASVVDIYQQYSWQFDLFRQLSTGLFACEYLLRIWSCPEAEAQKYQQAIWGRIRYSLTPLMIFDLLAILPVYLLGVRSFDFRLLRLFRLLSFFQVSRNSRALQIILSVIKRERKAFLATFLMISVLLIFISAIMYSIEYSLQPEIFASIPDAMWWTMTTITTVGYGDAVPLTPLGKGFGVLVMFLGVAMFAVPTGILVSAFYQELKRKDFLATWDLVAQVPFFANLHALEIARITDLLSLHVVRTGEIIFSQGHASDSMYFIVSGEVEINQNGRIIVVKGGDFFGELGVIYKTPRKATVKTLSYVELLRLDVKDLELFLELHPQLRQHILDEAEIRLNRSEKHAAS